jgi:hypothetical protein
VYIKSIGIKYNLFRDTAELFAEMEAKLLSVADTLGACKASTLAQAMAQQVCTLPQIIYPLQFYSFSEAQHDALTRLLLRLLRQVKVVGTCCGASWLMYTQRCRRPSSASLTWPWLKGGTLGGLWNACASAFSARKRRTSSSSLSVCNAGFLRRNLLRGSGRNGGRSPWCGGLSSTILPSTPFRSRTKGARYITVAS